MHYIDEGRGEPIVFVHGNPTWSFEFRHLILGLHDSYRCIAMDHIGFGLSSCSGSDKDYHPRAQATPFERSANAALPGYIIGASDWLGELWAENHQFIDKPALLLWGFKDIAFRRKEYDTWREHLTQAEPHEFPRRGHLIAEEAPEETIELTRAFIEKH